MLEYLTLVLVVKCCCQCIFFKQLHVGMILTKKDIYGQPASTTKQNPGNSENEDFLL